jgi:hypothetical protein
MYILLIFFAAMMVKSFLACPSLTKIKNMSSIITGMKILVLLPSARRDNSTDRYYCTSSVIS